jgi:hypothetical protein
MHCACAAAAAEDTVVLASGQLCRPGGDRPVTTLGFRYATKLLLCTGSLAV